MMRMTWKRNDYIASDGSLELDETRADTQTDTRPVALCLSWVTT